MSQVFHLAASMYVSRTDARFTSPSINGARRFKAVRRKTLIGLSSGLALTAAITAVAPVVGAQVEPSQPTMLQQVQVEGRASSTPFKVGDRYFFIAPSGALYVRESRTSDPKLVLYRGVFETVVPSHGGSYLAFQVQGASEVRVRDISRGRDIDTLRHAFISLSAWTRNNRGFFYVWEDSATGRQRIQYHVVGEPQARDLVVYSRPDQPDWRYQVRVSDDGQYVVITISHQVDDNTRMYFIDLDNPKKPVLNAPIVKLIDQFSNRYTFVDNGGYYFFLQTTRDAPNGHIVLANTNIIRETRWPSVVPQSGDTLLFARTSGDEYLITVSRNGEKVTARVYSPPDPREIQKAMRARADSIRRAGGREPRGTPRGASDRIGQPPGGAPGGFEVPILRLNLTRELPVPQGATLVDISSFAEDDELFYTVRFADGSVRAYIYNIKNRQNSLFSTTVKDE